MATLGEKARAKLRELREKAMDKETQRRVKAEIQDKFLKAKEILEKLEAEIRKPENRQKALEKLNQAKAQLARVKKEFLKKQRQARDYTTKNPEKALAVAAAAGALVGVLWSAARRRR